MNKNVSLYKDIKNLLKAEAGEVAINNIFYLKKWTCNRNNKTVDVITLEARQINGRHFIGVYTINARDVAGIIAEAAEGMKDGLQEVANRLVKDINAGYR